MSSANNTPKSDTLSNSDDEDDHNNSQSENEMNNEVVPPMKSWLQVAKGHADADADANEKEDVDDCDEKVDADNENNGLIGSWNNGQRPFTGAIQNYLDLMHRKLRGCVACLCTRTDYAYADVKVDPNTIIEVSLDDGTTRKYKFHSVHYGPLKKRDKRHWRSRDNIWERMGSYPPFRTLQIEMLREGYYLMDVSDPDKSKKMFIRLHRNKPETPLKLWHGYGVIPTLGSAPHGDPTTAPGVTIYPTGANFGMPPGIPAPMIPGLHPTALAQMMQNMPPGFPAQMMQNMPPGFPAQMMHGAPPGLDALDDLSETVDKMKAFLESDVNTILASCNEHNEDADEHNEDAYEHNEDADEHNEDNEDDENVD